MIRYGTLEEALKKMESIGLISIVRKVENIRPSEEGTAVTIFERDTCLREMESFVLEEGVGRDFEKNVVDRLGCYLDTGAYLEDRLANKSWKMYKFTDNGKIVYAIVNKLSDYDIDYD